MIALVNLGQRLAPVELQGRVAAAIGLLLFAPQPIAQSISALAIAVVDYRTLYLTVVAIGTANFACVYLETRRQIVRTSRLHPWDLSASCHACHSTARSRRRSGPR